MNAFVMADTARTEALASVRARVIACLMVVLFSSSCHDTVAAGIDAAVVFNAVHTQKKLTDVLLSESVSDVFKRHPSARQTEFGVEENVDGVTMRYFGERGESSEHVAASAAVTSIEATWHLDSDNAGNALWAKFLPQLSRAMTMPAECRRSDVVQRRYRIAMWTRHGGAVVMQQRMLNSTQSELVSPRTRPSISINLMIDSVALRPIVTWTRGVPCTP